MATENVWLTQKNSLAAITNSNTVIHVVDPDVTTGSPEGTSYKIRWGNLASLDGVSYVPTEAFKFLTPATLNSITLTAGTNVVGFDAGSTVIPNVASGSGDNNNAANYGDASGLATAAETNANTYTDTQISSLSTVYGALNSANTWSATNTFGGTTTFTGTTNLNNGFTVGGGTANFNNTASTNVPDATATGGISSFKQTRARGATVKITNPTGSNTTLLGVTGTTGEVRIRWDSSSKSLRITNATSEGVTMSYNGESYISAAKADMEGSNISIASGQDTFITPDGTVTDDRVITATGDWVRLDNIVIYGTSTEDAYTMKAYARCLAESDGDPTLVIADRKGYSTYEIV